MEIFGWRKNLTVESPETFRRGRIFGVREKFRMEYGSVVHKALPLRLWLLPGVRAVRHVGAGGLDLTKLIVCTHGV